MVIVIEKLLPPLSAVVKPRSRSPTPSVLGRYRRDLDPVTASTSVDAATEHEAAVGR